MKRKIIVSSILFLSVLSFPAFSELAIMHYGSASLVPDWIKAGTEILMVTTFIVVIPMFMKEFYTNKNGKQK